MKREELSQYPTINKESQLKQGYPKEFVRWCIDKITIEGPEEVYEYCWGADRMSFYSTDDLYQYWLTNVKDK